MRTACFCAKFPKISKNFQKNSKKFPKNFRKLPKISKNFQKFPKNFQKFPKISKNFQKISKNFKKFQKISKKFQKIPKMRLLRMIILHVHHFRPVIVVSASCSALYQQTGMERVLLSMTNRRQYERLSTFGFANTSRFC